MTVTELIENLESASTACGDEGFNVEEVAIDHAIEAIKVLQEIADKGCLEGSIKHRKHDGITGAACAYKAICWIDSLEAK